MRKKNGFAMDVKPVAVVSVNDGSVDVIVQCEKVGTVFCRVLRIGLEEYEATIWRMDDYSPLLDFTKNGLEAFQTGVHKICLGMVSDCYFRPDNWVVVEHQPEYDVLRKKENMSKEELSLGALKVRFPLFNDFGN